MGSGMSVVFIREGCREIGAWAFAGCGSLTDIYIPSSVVTIAQTAFAGGHSDLIIHGVPGTQAQAFAEARGFGFRAYEP